jgi:hypothetical protein
MSLHKPYFILENLPDKTVRVLHNCNGGINFRAEDIVSAETGRLLHMAIEEGMRRRGRDFAKLLEIEK